MARVSTTVVLNDQEVRNALIAAARETHKGEVGGGATVTVEVEGGKLKGVVEFVKRAE